MAWDGATPGADAGGTDPGFSTSPAPWRWAFAAAAVLIFLYPFARGWAGGVAALPYREALQSSFDLANAGRHVEAVAAAVRAIALDPSSADAYNNLAYSEGQLGRFDDAVRAAEFALLLRPDHQLAKNNLAWFRAQRDKLAAEAQATRAASLLAESLQHFRAGRFRECMETAKASSALTPDKSQPVLNVGICAANLGLWDEAIENTREAIRRDPDDPLARNNLAWIESRRRSAK